MKSSFAVIGLLGLCAPWAVLAASRSEAEESWITMLLVNWAPMLILVGVWIFFMRRMNGRMGWQTQYTHHDREHMERVEALLERIATALEGKHGPGR